MKEINIARTISKKRREKGITQEELAKHLGVSVAAVSKWETQQSYPDIVLLPQLAAFFNISIDELIAYQPQMEKEDIEKLHMRLYDDFSKKPFHEVIEECREIVKKYFSCFPLLLQMGNLLMGASALTENSQEATDLLTEAKALFVKVKTESEDAPLVRTALFMEASCAISLIAPEEAIGLLEQSIFPNLPQEMLLASAYEMAGKGEGAKRVLQEGIYQNILSTVGMLSTYALLVSEDAEKFDNVARRMQGFVDLFHIEKHQPFLIISFYITAAQVYMTCERIEEALEMLEQYAKLATSGFSVTQKADTFFDLVEDFAGNDGVGDSIAPHKVVKESLINAVKDNPTFEVLHDKPRFQNVIKKLESICGF